MKCQKELSITIADKEPTYECPGDTDGTLGPDGPRSLIRELQRSSSPFYCLDVNATMAQGHRITATFGDLNLGGVMDTYLYLLYKIDVAPDLITTAIDAAGGSLRWGDGYFVGKKIRITAGTNAGEERTIIDNQNTLLVLDSIINGGLDGTSLFEILDGARVIGTNDETFGPFTQSRTVLYYNSHNWPLNALSGFELTVTNGPFPGNTYAIQSNESNYLVLTSDTSGFMDSTWRYSIVVASDDDSGPGPNSRIIHDVLWSGNYVFEGTTYSTDEIGEVSFRFDCETQPELSADFDYSRSSCAENVMVIKFRDRSTKADSWSWDFGDGSPVSTLQNPTHIFVDGPLTPLPGRFSQITLTVTRDGSSASYSDTMGVAKMLKIDGYSAAFFILDGAGSCLSCDNSDWDGFLYPFLTTQWTPIDFIGFTGDQCSTIILYNNGAGNFLFRIRCSSVTIPLLRETIYTKAVADDHDPRGLYTLTTPDQITGPATLTIVDA